MHATSAAVVDVCGAAAVDAGAAYVAIALPGLEVIRVIEIDIKPGREVVVSIPFLQTRLRLLLGLRLLQLRQGLLQLQLLLCSWRLMLTVTLVTTNTVARRVAC